MARAIGTMAGFRGGVQAAGHGQGILARIGGFAAGLAQEWAVHRNVRALEALDGRTLADLGIARGEAERAVRFGIRARPGRRAGPVPFADAGELHRVALSLYGAVDR